MPEPITLVTSIAPRNIENQQSAIESWLRLGFSVTSLNTQTEADTLRQHFRGINFSVVSRDASADCGKPLVFLNDVLGFLSRRGSPVCGLINSDIHLRASPMVVQFLLEQARKAMVLFSRTDVAGLDDPAGTVYKHGFDGFLFDKEILGFLPSTDFCLGQPWWDYWFPSYLLRLLRQYPLKYVAFPLAVHVKHELNWNDEGNYEKYGMHFLKILDPRSHDAFLAYAPDQLRKSLNAYSFNVAASILLQSQWLSYVANQDPGPIASR